MAPIRIAIIGLSGSAVTGWASNAHLPYLLSPRGRSKYQIVAVCNSTVESAKKAIEEYSLSPDTKAYGDPEALADDPDIDLVVCVTRVDVHYPTILSSAKAGKNVFVEWPLASNAANAAELAALVKTNGSRSVVGLQGRFAPILVKLRELLHEQGRIGKVLSSELRGFGGTPDRETVISGLAYFANRAVGGNLLTIGFGHLFDQAQHVLGEFQDLTGQFQLQRPLMKLRDASTKDIVDTVRSDVPDLIVATASLKESPTVQKGATVLYRFRRGQPFKGEPAFVWTINGEKGEVRLTAWAGPGLHASTYTAPVTLEIHDFASDQVAQLDWQWADWQQELPFVARSIGYLYDEYAGGREAHDENLPTFEDAAKRHEQLESFISHWTQE